MKLCRFGNDRLGVVLGNKVHDVTSAQEQIRASAPYAMHGDAVIAALPEWRGRLEDMAAKAPGMPLSEVKLLAPVARPSKVMAAPTNYRAHVEEMGKDPNRPRASGPRKSIDEAGIFLKANSSLVGPSEGIGLRYPEKRNDHEAEIVFVIGKKGSGISRERGLEYVAGYSLGLDMTLRGTHDRSFKKSLDGFSVMGPWMITADEIANPNAIPFSLKLNGEMRQQSSTTELIYDIGRLIEFASSYYTLYPGDVFYTGTPDGVGPVKPGDRLRVESPLIGAFEIDVGVHQN